VHEACHPSMFPSPRYIGLDNNEEEIASSSLVKKWDMIRAEFRDRNEKAKLFRICKRLFVPARMTGLIKTVTQLRGC
jgi:hypothetical protein